MQLMLMLYMHAIVVAFFPDQQLLFSAQHTAGFVKMLVLTQRERDA